MLEEKKKVPDGESKFLAFARMVLKPRILGLLGFTLFGIVAMAKADTLQDAAIVLTPVFTGFAAIVSDAAEDLKAAINGAPDGPQQE